MDLEKFGFDSSYLEGAIPVSLDEAKIGRIISEHRKRYIVRTLTDEYSCEVHGKVMFRSNQRFDYPAVGDFVAIDNVIEDQASIEYVFPRKSILCRRAVGPITDSQIIATNIDFALIVQAVDRDFSINRIERYLTICAASNISPVLILSKTDLIDKNELNILKSRILERIKDLEIITIKNSQADIIDLKNWLISNKTYCLLGSSGVGKSTLINNLTGSDKMQTGSIGEKSNRGMHVTTYRELIFLDNGAMIIDNPGMKEVGVNLISSGIDLVFKDIVTTSKQCKFNDCTHTIEKACAVRDALAKGDINKDSFENYQKMKREILSFKTDLIERGYKNKSGRKR